MKQYHDLLYKVLQEGHIQPNRTGVDTIGISGAMMQFDLTHGFPVLTTRKYPWKSPIAEMIGFINGFTNAAKFRELGCKFWDQNANENQAWLNNPNRQGTDDLGEIYGFQARNWRTDDVYFDQFRHAIDQIINDPTSRRILVSHWRPDRFEHMALPPCHVLYQFMVNTVNNELSMTIYMRSNDLFLGAPANIIEYAWLLEVVAMATGKIAKTLTYMIADAHIYNNHADHVTELLHRAPFDLPTLKCSKKIMVNATTVQVVAWLESLRVEDFHLDGYHFHPAISAPMAV